MKMLKKTPVGQRRVYDIEVEDVHNFYANGVNVHNCATAGGVSVIKDDGTVVNSASTRSYSDLAILDTFALHAIWGGGESTDYFNDIRNLSSSFTTSRSFNSATVPKLNVAGQVSTAVTAITGGFVQGTISNKSLNVVAVNPADVSKSSVAYISSTYNTGWMPGNIKGAFLADTDDTDLVGSGELVTNGTFNTDTSGWTVDGNGKGITATVSGGQVTIDSTAASSGGPSLTQTVSGLTGGTKYVITFTVVSINTGYLAFYNSGTSTQANYVAGTHSVTFTGGTSVLLDFKTTAVGQIIVLDNISVKLADADRSVNNNGLIVNGTITRTYVDEV